MDKNNWLDDLKEGDVVAVSFCGYRRNQFSLSYVKRLTKTKILVGDNEKRFSRKTGNEIGGTSFYPTHLQKATDEIKVLVKTRTICEKLSEVTWERFSLEQTTAVYNLVKTFNAP